MKPACKYYWNREWDTCINQPGFPYYLLGPMGDIEKELIYLRIYNVWRNEINYPTLQQKKDWTLPSFPAILSLADWSPIISPFLGSLETHSPPPHSSCFAAQCLQLVTSWTPRVRTLGPSWEWDRRVQAHPCSSLAPDLGMCWKLTDGQQAPSREQAPSAANPHGQMGIRV